MERVFVSHLLEARHFRKDALGKEPFQAITAEFDLDAHPLLSYRSRQFLSRLRPAILHGWVVLEEYPLDVGWSKRHLNLSKAETEQAIQECCKPLETLTGLAKVMALLCKAKRSSKGQALTRLQQAQQQTRVGLKEETSEFLADFWLYRMGNGCYEMQAYEEAIAAYGEALQIKPDFHETPYSKGIALRKLGRYEEAIAAYDAALKVKLDNHEALHNKGNALGDLGRYEEAIAVYDAALKIKPDFHEALTARGGALAYLGKFDEAMTAFDTALAIKPNHDNTMYCRACTYALQNQIEPALNNLAQAIQLNPEENCEMAKTDSDFDAIRNDPRFQALLR